MPMVITEMNEDRGREHFTEADWVAFAQGQGDADHRAEVARHLEAGCVACERTVRLWAALLSVADQETADGSIKAAIRQVSRRFAGHRRRLADAASQAVALVFDSFHEPQLAGIRASGLSPRHLLYKAGHYTIKLQVEPAGTADRVSIVGQILNEEDPTGVLRHIAVRALKGTRTLDRTLTNELGEFHLEPDASETLRLSIDVPEIGTFSVQPPGSAPALPRASGRKDTEGAGPLKKKARSR
jgi:hypothetical protein